MKYMNNKYNDKYIFKIYFILKFTLKNIFFPEISACFIYIYIYME